MIQDFTHSVLGRTGIEVHRLGLSATYRPGKKTLHRALDAGLNYVFMYGFDTQMKSVLRDEIVNNRDRFVIATGAYNYIWWHSDIRKTLEKRLRQLRTDHIDVFLFMGVMKEKEFPEHIREELYRLKEEGKVRAIGISTHDRKFAGKLATDGAQDVLMVRYNAAHRGAEEDVFPHLQKHNPGIISFTATRWRYLIKRPSGYPKGDRLPTPGECYRFVLSNPNVDVCMMAPSNQKQLEHNLTTLEEGPLSDEDMEFMKQFGDRVHHTRKWFM
ncbi:MAG: aldo/keto reductase [candidate division Zixibacteria bacterium]|nr:aldo/keto reductase [candidate division Zixibacteria bacterium]